MSSKRVLLLSNYHIQAYHVTRGKIIRDVKLGLEDDYWPTLSEYLKKDVRSPLYLITNILEEEFQLENVPHTRGRDRKLLLDRKKEQMFRGESFADYRVVGREKTGRKDDKVLFYTMHESAALSELLTRIEEMELALAGIYSVPLLIQQCLKDILPDSNILVLSEVDNHVDNQISFRQCFFTNGALALTRLSTFHLDQSNNVTDELADEVDGSRRYLTSHRILDPFARLTTLVLVSDSTVKRTGRLKLPQEFDVQYARPERIAEVLKLKCADQDVFFDDVLAGDLCRHRSKRHYGTKDSLFHYRHHQARWGIAMASLALAATVSLFAGSLVLSGMSINHGNEELAALLEKDRLQVEKLEASSPELAQAAEQLEAAVLSVEWLQQHTLPPDQLMTEISTSLRLFPDIVISELHWERAGAEDGGMAQAEMPDPMADMNGADPMAAAAPSTDNDASRKQEKFVVTLKGKKDDYAGELRHAIDRIQAFANRLEASEGVISLELTKLPVDLSSEARVTGEITGMMERVDQSTAEFELEMTLVNKHARTTYL
ncbi:MAG: hypothetical protein AB8B48_00945 [Pseudomonadales bacterium]